MFFCTKVGEFSNLWILEPKVPSLLFIRIILDIAFVESDLPTIRQLLDVCSDAFEGGPRICWPNSLDCQKISQGHQDLLVLAGQMAFLSQKSQIDRLHSPGGRRTFVRTYGPLYVLSLVQFSRSPVCRETLVMEIRPEICWTSKLDPKWLDVNLVQNTIRNGPRNQQRSRRLTILSISQAERNFFWSVVWKSTFMYSFRCSFCFCTCLAG